MKIILEQDDGSKTEFEVSKVTKFQGGRVVSEVASPTQRFEVQHFTLCDGWINCWTEDEKPLTFASYAEAEADLDYFLCNAVDYDPTDYRIEPVQS